MPLDVESIVTAHTRDDIRQHHPDCELDHPVCAIIALAAQITLLENRLADVTGNHATWVDAWHTDTAALEAEVQRLHDGIVRHRQESDLAYATNAERRLWALVDLEEAADG